MYMNNLRDTILPAVAATILAAVLSPAHMMAQAPPGPISATPVPSSPRTAPTQQQRPEPPRAQPRTAIFGAWRLNRDQSSLPEKRDDVGYGGNYPNGGGYPNGGNGPYGGSRRGTGNPGGGYPGGGYPGGGYPGGSYPGGGYPGGNGPYGGPNNGGGYPDGRQQAAQRQAIPPATWMNIEQKDNEIDVIDDRNEKTAFFTDGRKLQNSKNDKTYHEVAAHWEGQRLVTDEKSPRGDKMSRTFELAPDGSQLIETVHVDSNRANELMTMRYVYDISRY
jgi:hypothetical protein